MASKAIEQAFQRHPRPQGVPTKGALLERALQKAQRSSLPTRELHESPWNTLTRQGELTQGTHVWSICVQQEGLVLVKETSIEAGRDELEKLTKLSDHPNVATIKQAFQTDSSCFFQFEYSRVTLEEVLSVHTRLEEKHIRVIASSVSFLKRDTNFTDDLLDLSCNQACLNCWNSAH
jgi:serine/threonine protein kinase